jgi:hypothetical protein
VRRPCLAHFRLSAFSATGSDNFGHTKKRTGSFFLDRLFDARESKDLLTLPLRQDQVRFRHSCHKITTGKYHSKGLIFKLEWTEERATRSFNTDVISSSLRYCTLHYYPNQLRYWSTSFSTVNTLPPHLQKDNHHDNDIRLPILLHVSRACLHSRSHRLKEEECGRQ